MARRLLMLGLLAALSQIATGCCCLRERIAYRWQYFHAHHGCATCAPAFRVPPPVMAGPPVPVYHGPPAAGPGCPSCYSPPDVGPVAYGGPIAGPAVGPYPGPVESSGIPMLSAPTPLLHGPTIEPSSPGIPSTMPPKTGSN